MCGVIVPSIALTVNRLFSPLTALSICLNTSAGSSQIAAQAGGWASLGKAGCAQSLPSAGPCGAVTLPVLIFPTRPFKDPQSPGLLFWV